MSINFEWYKIFYFAAKTGSYTRAAEALFVTQSSISQTIRQLEETLGVKLFARAGRGVKLTAEGHGLYDHVEQAYHLLVSGEQYMSSMQSLQTGQIRIGASDTISKYNLLKYLRKFHEDWPNIRIGINNRPSPVSVELAKKGEIDLGVINLDPDKPYDGLMVHPLTRIRNVFIAPAAWRDQFMGPVSLGQLEGFPIVALEQNSTTRRIFEKYKKEHGANLHVEFEFGSMDLIVEMTRIGMGVGFVAESAARAAILSGDVVRLQINEPIPQIEVGVVHSDRIPLNLAAQKMLELMLDKDFRQAMNESERHI